MNPIPIIDQTLCRGCGLCVIACSHHAMTLYDGQVVVDAAACDYLGLCEMICPVQAIVRPFLIIMPSPDKEPRRTA